MRPRRKVKCKYRERVVLKKKERQVLATHYSTY